MEQGSLGELFLTRSVTKHIRKNNKSVVTGAAVGNDYARLSICGDVVTSATVFTEPDLAWIKAFNNLAVSGAKKIGAVIVLLLPVNALEKEIKEYMKCFNSLADENGVQIIGGESQVSAAYKQASFCVTAYGEIGGDGCMDGEKSRSWCRRTELIKEGCDIVLSGYAGVLGSQIIAREKYDELAAHFSKSYIDDFLAYADDLSVEKAADIMVSSEVFYMHDISWGGIYGGLWQLGVGIKKGINIEHSKIKIRQETIELSEYFNINPYMLEGTGAMLGVCADGEETADRLASNGIPAAVIGKVTSDKERIVVAGDEKRFLQPPKSDELYKVIE